ncbi:MAG: hypothetical protein KY447_08205 [Actinobacteria bacterium]|nr:hypothetical protein [Actinomycetota bacterium]MBW3642879.1 hypothetical protein [Actinomycetota bacterium]
MTGTYEGLAAATAAADVVAVCLAAVAGGRRRDGLRMGLDLWVAAGLLRLGAEVGWNTVAAAASVVAVRQLAGYGLRHSLVG